MIDLHTHSLYSDGELIPSELVRRHWNIPWPQVASMAKECGAKLVLNSDAHSPRDLITHQFAQMVTHGAGLGKDAFDKMLGNSQELIKKIS